MVSRDLPGPSAGRTRGHPRDHPRDNLPGMFVSAPRRRAHRAAARRPKTASTETTSRTTSMRSGVLPKVGDPDADGILDNHDFAATDLRAADQNVDVFSGGAPHGDDAAGLEREKRPHRHGGAVQLH